MIRNDTDYALRMLVPLAEQSLRRVDVPKLSNHSGMRHDSARNVFRKLTAATILEVY